MAFPVPNHLPKRPLPVDVSSKILYKIDAATKDTLNSSLAASWLQDLDKSIQETKQDIHDRIQSNLPKFQQQLETATSAQSRYNALNTQVDELSEAISHPKTGLLPNVMGSLKAHSELAQEASDARLMHTSLLCLQKIRNAFVELSNLTNAGRLPEAVSKGQEVDEIVKEMPGYLQQTHAANDLKRRFTATKTRVQDQLGDAFLRSIVLSATELVIHPIIQVRQSEAMLELPAILNSIAPTTLSTYLSTLRRDFLTHFIDNVLKQPYSIVFESSFVDQAKLTLIPAPPNTEDLSSRLDNASNILGFLYTNVIAHLPSQESIQFMRSLSKPVTTSVLENLLKPTLPFSFGLLPSYLQVLKRAVAFEETEISGLLQNVGGEGPIKEWSDNVSGHYERRRRVEILEHARNEILGPDDSQDTFVAYTEGGPETSLPSVVPIQIESDEMEDDAWGLDEPVTAAPVEDTTNGWGFDDNMEDLPDEVEADLEPSSEQEREKTPEPLPPSDANDEPDPDDAWGWNDDAAEEPSEPMEEENVGEEPMEEDNPWDDDPWADPPAADGIPEVAPVPKSPTTPAAASVVSPKAATRLEKLASKKIKHINGNGTSSTSSTPAPTPPALNPDVMFTAPSPTTSEHNPPPKTSRLNPGKRRPQEVVTTLSPKEVYKVPKRAKRIIKMVETSIDESKLFFASNLFGSVANASFSAPGSVLVQSASSIVDLFQALYPVKFATGLQSPERAMLFSNMCLYMSGAVQRVEDTIYGQPELKERLAESRKQLQILGDSWYEDSVERQCRLITEILVNGAQGFAYTMDQDRYDDCETAVNDILKKIKSVSHSLKDVLTKTKYYAAIGSVVEAALSRILADILALPDITEVESHRLSELCRILNALEFLFSEDSQQPSFVVASVPSWLKFSYLSELLEASLVDVTYLFEQGALVDFQVDELVNLVRALFADTTLRANTITKIQGSQPASHQ